MAEPLELVSELLRTVRRGGETGTLETRLASLSSERLSEGLTDDRDRRAFWVNVHNAYVQILLLRDPSQYDRRRFFARDQVPVANEWLSLDDAVHGLLRRSRWKYGFGYLPRPFVDEFERIHRVETRDWRIHFALNRGTLSCPPVAVYDPADVDEQLDAVVSAYLDDHVTYDPSHDRVRVPRQFRWHRRDFGGRSGILSILRSYGLVPEDANPTIRYESFDWRLDPDRWADGTSDASR